MCMNALPVLCLQLAQWQSTMDLSSPVTDSETDLQRHVEARVVVGEGQGGSLNWSSEDDIIVGIASESIQQRGGLVRMYGTSLLLK